MTDTTPAPIRPLEPAAMRGFKALAAVALGTTAFAAIGVGASHLAGHPMGVLPAAAIGAVWAVHLLRERLGAIVWGRRRLGLPDAMARSLAKEAWAVARREPDGAWVVLSEDGRKVDVMDRAGFEKAAAAIARDGGVLKVARPEGDGFVVERYEAGVLRDPDEAGMGGDAVETYDRRGRLVDTRSVEAPIPEARALHRASVDDAGTLTHRRITPRTPGSPPVEVEERRLPDFVKPGTDLAAAVGEALARGPVHVRRGATWLRYPGGAGAPGDAPAVVADRAFQRVRRAERDLVEVYQDWRGVRVDRLAFGRLDSAAHGGPARLTFDPEGRATGTEWYVEGRPADEEEAMEAHAGYGWAPSPG